MFGLALDGDLIQKGNKGANVSIELYVPFLARELGTIPQRVKPERAEPGRVQALLWPAASFFRTVAGIATYREEAEAEADAVLEALEADPSDWIDFSSDAARVLYDRTLYILTVLQANELAGEKVTCPPSSLDEELQRVAAVLLWLHRTEVPLEFRGRG
jgi:hypothetical protein